MGRRRLTAALLALVLAACGAVLLTGYVRGADERALAGMTTTQVLVVATLIPAGTTVDEAKGLVTRKTLPMVAVAPGALSTLAELGGLVAAADLQPGLQLMAAQFVDPASLQDPDQVAVPAGLQQVSVSLDRERVLGSALVPGDTVGVFISLAAEGAVPAETQLAVQKVLVTSVGDPTSGPPSTGGGGGVGAPASAAPTDKLLVTVAVKARDAEKIVFGATHGTLWLSRQSTDSPPVDQSVMTRKEVYR